MRNRFSYLETIFVLIVFGILIGALLLNKGNTYRKDISLSASPGRPDTVPKGNLLEIKNGTLIISVSSACAPTWKALNVGGDAMRYSWCSAKGAAFPHAIVFELSQPYAVTGMAVDNSGTKEAGYPGISSRDIAVYGSMKSTTEGLLLLIDFVVPKGSRKEVKLDKPITVQWLKVMVNSNWGNPEYTEVMGIEAFGLPIGSPPQVNVTGIYQTNYGPLKLEQNGSRVLGCYDFAQGKLSGDLNGRVMQAEWRQEQDKRFGTAIMVFSMKGDALYGFWYENGKLAGEWSGVRGGKPPVCKLEK